MSINRRPALSGTSRARAGLPGSTSTIVDALLLLALAEVELQQRAGVAGRNRSAWDLLRPVNVPERDVLRRRRQRLRR